MGLTRCAVVAPAWLRSHERAISFSWKARTFAIATPKLSSSSGERDSRPLSISLCGTRISCGLTPSKRSVYSRRAASPLSRTSSTIRRAASRTACERKPPGRRNSPTISAGPRLRASTFLTTWLAVPLYRVGQGYNLAVAQTVRAAIGDQTRRRGGDLIEHHEVVLAQCRACRCEVDDALCEADEGRKLYGTVQLYDLGLAAHALEVAPCCVGELGRDPDDFGVANGPPYVFGPARRGGQDHTAPPRPQVPQLDHVGPLLIEHVLADDADVRGPVLDEDGHIGGPADDKFGTFCPVDEPSPVLAENASRESGHLQRRERVSEDSALGHGDAQSAHGSIVLATDSKLMKTNTPAGSTVATFTPPAAGEEIQAASTLLAYSTAAFGGRSSERCNTGTPSLRSRAAAAMPLTSPPTRTSKGWGSFS